jgi:twitching motility protein PilT
MELTEVCTMAVKQGASDIHLKVGLPPVVRIDGELAPLKGCPRLNSEAVGQMAWNIMSATQREKFKKHHDIDMAWTLPGVGRFRVNVFLQRHLMGMVLRVIPDRVQTIDELKLPPILKQLAGSHRGMILVTGATGSGKSTTLAAIVEEINQVSARHVLTIEDPIEFNFRDNKSIINQREVGTDSDNFPAALRAALRQDPDVILVGELRDRESMEIALQAAETGHLVMGTVHTLDCPETINRVTGFFDPHHQKHVRYQLAAILKAVISQRLVPANAGGRIAAMEIMMNTGAIRECIIDPSRTREIPDHITKGSKIYGCQSFDQAVYRLLKSNMISQVAAMAAVNNPDELALRLRGIATEDWE